jgi:hypothetical protein
MRAASFTAVTGTATAGALNTTIAGIATVETATAIVGATMIVTTTTTETATATATATAIIAKYINTTAPRKNDRREA